MTKTMGADQKENNQYILLNKFQQLSRLFIKRTYRLEKEIFQAPYITKYAKYLMYNCM